MYDLRQVNFEVRFAMERWVGKIAVVTGASSGIGRAIAEKLAQAGVVTVGLARRLDRLEELKSTLPQGNFHHRKCDVTDESELVAAFGWIKEELGPISILINNAGILGNGKVCEQPTDVLRRVFETNVIALSAATREAVASMRESGIAGHVVNINSVAGHGVPVFEEPEAAGYPASKHAVTALTEILRQEMNYYKTGIKVTSISPGFTHTEIFDSQGSRFDSADLAALEPEDVANAVMYAIGTPPRVQVHELTIKAVGEIF